MTCPFIGSTLSAWTRPSTLATLVTQKDTAYLVILNDSLICGIQ